MSDRFTTLQTEVAARLEAHATIAPIPIVTEDKGSLATAIDNALATGGVKDGDTGKVGLCLVIITPSGQTTEHTTRALRQEVTVRVSLIVAPELNAGESGHQLAPLAVVEALLLQLITWDRGNGARPVRHTAWDSTATEDEIVYSADFQFQTVLQ